jgi:hypothetical protein
MGAPSVRALLGHRLCRFPARRQFVVAVRALVLCLCCDSILRRGRIDRNARRRRHHPSNNHVPLAATNNREGANKTFAAGGGSSSPSSSSSLGTEREGAGEVATAAETIVWNGSVGDWNYFLSNYWKTNTLCDQVIARQLRHNNSSSSSSNNETVVKKFRFHFGCRELFHRGRLGTGNFVTGLYGLRLAAISLNVDATIACRDADGTREDLVLPWLTGRFAVPSEASWRATPFGRPPSAGEGCSTYNRCPIGYLLGDMRYELRRMAIALVGVPNDGADHPSAAWAEQHLWTNNDDNNNSSSTRNQYQLLPPKRDDAPLFPNVELDEAVIHFRCGDVVNSNHKSYGFMKFKDLSRYLSPESRSIGIVTQPVRKVAQQRRKSDEGTVQRERCSILLDSLVEYLGQNFPRSTRITVRNDPSESVALAYARMIMANQTVAGMSSFSVFALVSGFGTGFLRRPGNPSGPYRWVDPRGDGSTSGKSVDQLVDNVVLTAAPNVLLAPVNKFLWDTGRQDMVLSWFWNETMKLDPEDVVQLLS